MRRWFFLLLILFETITVSAAVIQGRVYYFAPNDPLRRLQFVTPDYTSMKPVSHYASVDSLGYFTLELSLLEPTEVQLRMSGHQQPFLLAPADTLRLTVDWNEWRGEGGMALRITGRVAARQQQLRELDQAFAKKFAPWSISSLVDRPPRTVRTDIRERHLQEMAFWRSWQVEDPILQEYLLHRAFFSAPRQYFRYAVRKKAPEGPLSPSPEFFDFWSAVLGQQTIAVQSFALQRILSTYTNYLNFTVPEAMTDLLPDSASLRMPQIIRAQGRWLAKTDLPRAMRDRLLTLLLGNSLDFQEMAPGVAEEAIAAIQTPFLRKQVQEKYDQMHTVAPRGIEQGWEILLPDTLSSLVEFLHRKFSGRYIVIDFWGTWCAPCIQTMQHILPGWLQRHAGPDIVVVFVALGSPRPLWIEEVNTLPFVAPHIFAAQSLDDLIEREFGIRGLPHYSVIGPRGELLWRQAKAPGKGLSELLPRSN